MEDEFIAAVLGNLLAGLGVWGVTAILIYCGSTVRARRARRRNIIALVTRAQGVAFSAINEGLFDEAWIRDSNEPLRESKTRYDDLTAQALNMFTTQETDVAFWCAAELYAGWWAPLRDLASRDVPRAKTRDGRALVTNLSIPDEWQLARPEMLASWADVWWPWDISNRRGPQYATRDGDGYTAGDRSRHIIVRPNSDVNGDMLRPYANMLRSPSWEARGRRARELRRMFPDGYLAR